MEDNQIIQEETNENEPNSNSEINPDSPPEDDDITPIELAKQSVRDELQPRIDDLEKENKQLKYLLKNTQTTPVVEENKPNWKDKIVKWH